MKLLACLPLLLAACASVPPAQPLNLQLAPATLGRELALQQRMTVTVQGRSRQLDVAIEADPDAVRLAVLDLGQTVARMEWDGRTLRQSLAPGWPAAIDGARVLSDLQLVHWPLAAIRAALPVGWSVEASDAERVLRFRGTTVVHVRYPLAGTAELEHPVAGYRVRLEGAQP
jgi:hypothetical protein